MESFDLIVIGSGPAGEKGAAQAACFGRRVALIERGPNLGGAGVNTGTMPSKKLRESALYFSGLRQRGLNAVDYALREGLTVQGFMYRKDAVVSAERLKIATNLAAHKIEVIGGTAEFEDAHTVKVITAHGASRSLCGENFLIPTGSRPHRPAELPFDDATIFDSDSILSMDRLPKSMIVVGGGVIGCEYASIFSALGVDVTLVDGRERLLPFLDSEISELLRARLASLGLKIYFQERLKAAARTPAAGPRKAFGLVRMRAASSDFDSPGRERCETSRELANNNP